MILTDRSPLLPIDAQFVFITHRGKALKEGQWGNFDESFRFILGDEEVVDKKGHALVILKIVGSSNGFLLLHKFKKRDRSQQDFIVCNPLTREFRYLPRPRSNDGNYRYYGVGGIAFICEGVSSSLDEVQFKVIRVAPMLARGSRGRRGSWTCTILAVEVFSSIMNTWTDGAEYLVSDVPFFFGAILTSAHNVIGEVIFWDVCSQGRSAILAYDQERKNVKVIKFPWDQEGGCSGCNGVCRGCGEMFGISEGKLQYARFDQHNAEFWVMEDHQWVMKRRLPQIPWSDCYDGKLVSNEDLRFVGFHPQHSDRLLLTYCKQPHWWDLAKNKVKCIGWSHVYREEEEDYLWYESPLPLPHDRIITT